MKRIKYVIFLFILSIIYVPNVYAAGATITAQGGTMYPGEVKEYNITINNITEKFEIIGINFKYSSSDTSCLTIVEEKGFLGGGANNGNYGYATPNVVASGSKLLSLKVRANKVCQARINISNVDLSDGDDIISGNVISNTINVINPPSSNANLSSLSVSQGSISFNKDNTNYNINVENNVSSINVSGTVEDSLSQVSGLGNHNLNYGNNKINIIVKSQSGNTKTYTINVNRKDNRSSNNNLSELKISNGELNPGFNKNTTNYKMNVPFEVSKLNIKAIQEDSKAKVNITGNSNFTAEETQNVYIKVTAENGSSKTYTISVTRGKDPNKKLSDDNYLTKIEPSIGILSPVFNKDIKDYVIYLPYEVDKISFDVSVSDTRYATLTKDEPEQLQSGITNKYTYTVKAENNEERVYTIVVKRAIDPKLETSSNTYLKNIKLSNGKLLFTNGKKVSNFDKNTKKYYYEKRRDFKYSAEAEDSNSNVVTVIDGTTINFIVEAPNGDFSIYTLELYGSYHKYTYILLFLLGLVVGIIIMILKNKFNIKINIKYLRKNKKGK